MDLIGAYQSELHIPENAARGLAGQLLGLIEDTVREQVSFGIAARVRDAVPEMLDWQLSSPTLRPGSVSLDDFPQSSMLDPRAEWDSLFARFALPPEHATLARRLALDFLASRLEDGTFHTVRRALP